MTAREKRWPRGLLIGLAVIACAASGWLVAGQMPQADEVTEHTGRATGSEGGSGPTVAPADAQAAVAIVDPPVAPELKTKQDVYGQLAGRPLYKQLRLSDEQEANSATFPAVPDAGRFVYTRVHNLRGAVTRAEIRGRYHIGASEADGLILTEVSADGRVIESVRAGMEGGVLRLTSAEDLDAQLQGLLLAVARQVRFVHRHHPTGEVAQGDPVVVGGASYVLMVAGERNILAAQERVRTAGAAARLYPATHGALDELQSCVGATGAYSSLVRVQAHHDPEEGTYGVRRLALAWGGD